MSGHYWITEQLVADAQNRIARDLTSRRRVREARRNRRYAGTR